MMKKLTPLFALIFIALVSSSCGLPLIGKHVVHKSGSRLYASTHGAFQPYVAKFEADGKVHTQNPNFSVGDIPINFHDPEANEHQGVCYIYSDNSREIIIRRDWWERASTSDDDRESLIFHELGHCKLDRDHKDATTANGYKLSMMNSFIVIGVTYQQHATAYLKELFTQDDSALIQTFTGTQP